MLLWKSNLLVCLLLLMPSYVSATFNDNECIKNSFETKISHKAAPFGLTKRILTINKNQCEIVIEHEKLKFMKKKWLVDVCRSPVHIKSGHGTVEVIKKQGECLKTSENEFCEVLSTIESIIQDDGLIFASGEKETLSTDHGKVFCTHLLLKKYLRENYVFNRHEDYSQFLTQDSRKQAQELKEMPKEENPIAPQMEQKSEPSQDGQSSDF